MQKLGIMLLFAGALHACTAVEGERILGRDLAKANPKLAGIPQDFVLGYAPIPGRQRVVEGQELLRIARAHGVVEESFQAVCFERPTVVLTEEDLRPVLEKALGADVRLEISDFSRYPVPRGELIFFLKDLARPPIAQLESPVVWRGHIKYDTNGSAVIWAKVKVAKLERWVETSAAIPARRVIDSEQLVEKSGWRYPFSLAPVTSASDAIGKQLIRSLPAGQMVMPSMLTAANDVERGDVVNVLVSSGGVTLRFDAKAETGGHRNETVLVSLLDSGKRLMARIQDKGKVIVNADQNRSNSAVVRGGDSVRNAGTRGLEGGQGEAESGAGIAAGSLPR